MVSHMNAVQVALGAGFTGNGLTFYSDEKAILRLCESPLRS